MRKVYGLSLHKFNFKTINDTDDTNNKKLAQSSPNKRDSTTYSQSHSTEFLFVFLIFTNILVYNFACT